MTSLPRVQSQITLSSTFLQLEMDSGPASQLTPNIRFAIALSVDRQALVDTQVNWALSSVQVATSHIYGQGQTGYPSLPLSSSSTTLPAGSTTSTSTPTTLIGDGGSINFPVTPSTAQATSLMIASGYSRVGTGTWHSALGVPLSVDLVVDEGDPWAVSVGPLVAAQLEAAGFAVTLTPAASATAAGELLSTRTADVALIPRTSSPFLSQALAWYTDLLGPPGQDGSQDWTGYESSMFDSLVTRASQQLNPSTAATDYTAADEQLWNDVVALPLFTEPTTLIWSRKVSAVTQTPTNNSLLWYAQYWAVRVPEATNNTTPALPTP
jgi:ABC-type transport system substrate-binding protein